MIGYWIVPTWSHKARWLTEDERARLLARLAADSDAANKEKFQWVYVRQALGDHLVWGYAFLFHGFSFVLYTLSLFMVSTLDLRDTRIAQNKDVIAYYHRRTRFRNLESSADDRSS